MKEIVGEYFEIAIVAVVALSAFAGIKMTYNYILALL